MPNQQSNYLRHIMTTLWGGWIVSMVALALALLLPRLLPLVGLSKMWLPLPIFVMAWGLAYYERTQSQQKGMGACAVLHAVGLTLFWSALIMVIINVLNSRMMLDGLINWSNSNREIPFITCLIMFPVLTVMCLWVMANGYEQTMAEGYRARNGIVPGNGAVASLLSIENRYQVKMVLWLSLALNVVEWWYYFVYYFNVNMNTPDIFFFNWMPITLFVIMLFFMASRYKNLAALIGPIAISARQGGTAIRYIMISGDKILLAPDTYGRWDTPAVTNLGALDAHNDVAIKEAFEKISGIEDFSLRFLYETGIPGEVEIMHYAVFLPEEYSFDNWPEAQWKTIDEIDRIIKSATMAAEFTDEIYRIFTITITWKTYDANGRRIYPIKNYRPAFKIREMKDWDVDYSDLHWLDVAKNNQDKPFYRTKRLWRKITGYRPG